MPATLADLEKQIAALKTALDGKKDKKSAEQEAQKFAEHQKAVANKFAENAQLQNRLMQLEIRVINLEAQVKAALAMASAK